MKKILNFFCNTPKGEKIVLGCTVGMMISFVIGLMLSVPMLWLGHRVYEQTWMNNIAPYFFIPFGAYVVLFLMLFVPYMSYVAGSKNYEGDSKGFMQGMAIFCSIFPGAFIYSQIAKALFIPSGIHNLAGMLICGLIYLLIVKAILRKPFRTAQTFVSLD